MQVNFPENLYTDIRIEKVFETKISFKKDLLNGLNIKEYEAVFIRVFDGQKWYYSSTTDLSSVQNEVNSLSNIAIKNSDIKDNPIYKKLKVNKGETLKFKGNNISNISKEEKIDLIKEITPLLKKQEAIKLWEIQYVDQYKVKEFYSSKGSDIKHDYQRCGYQLSYNLIEGKNNFKSRIGKHGYDFNQLKLNVEEIVRTIEKELNFMRNAVPVEPGKYTVILAPIVTGMFAHECFGHMSESDSIIGNDAAQQSWKIGRKVCDESVSIIDDGNILGYGYTPFDDEGTKASKTYLIKNGILNGRMHNSTTAALLDEEMTGNARALSFEYEPIIRMTSTYFDKGTKTKEELISEVKNGIYVETINHGVGMGTFTLAPNTAYYIRDGKIEEPVKISVLTGQVFDTIANIDGLSEEVSMETFVVGGCGKADQYSLPVGFGGPYIRVKNMNVQ